MADVKQTDKKMYQKAETFGIPNVENAQLDSFTPGQLYTIARPVLGHIAETTVKNKHRWQIVLKALIKSLDDQYQIKE